MLPMKSLVELDRRLSTPLHLDLKRPQLRSHPYLQGLNLLLRASGLSRVEGVGARARLVLDPAILVQWDRLNPTERYFNLMEAWLRLGRAEMVGEKGSSWGDLLLPCLQAWSYLPAKGLQFDPKKPREFYIPGVYRNYFQPALMDLFGLLEIQQSPRPVATWSPASIKHVPFGDAVFTLIDSFEFGRLMSRGLPEDDEEDEDEEEGEPEVPPLFGAWQPLFQPYFPEWRENLEFPEPEPREGEFIFRVSLGRVWRLISMPADATVDDLVRWVLRSMKFGSDHLYEVTYRDRMGAQVSANHPAMEEGPWADQVPIGSLPIEPGQAMQLLYDFGDSWRFTIKLERIEPPVSKKAKKPRILESHGEAPPQYPDWDE
jgi:Plasmid pRiA4b ORF-3-like protein